MSWNDVEEQARNAEIDNGRIALVPGRFPDRPIQAGLLFAPSRVELNGDRLIWLRDGSRYKRPWARMLPEFLALGEIRELHDFRPAALRYARQWGVLGICHHDLPASHGQSPFGLLSGIQPCLPVLDVPHVHKDNSGPWHQEPLESWRTWSRKIKALLSIAYSLNQGKSTTCGDWQTVQDAANANPFQTATDLDTRDKRTARRDLAEQLDTWISMGQVRPRILWERSHVRWRFDLDSVCTGPNLFGLLMLYVAAEVMGTGRGIAICSSCGQSYTPDRRPNPDRRNYCVKCRGESGKDAARRDASRAWRERHARAGRGR